MRKPSDDEVGKLRDGQVLIGFLQPLTDQEGIERLASRGVTAFAMESIPRITRAQSMDALSSQATVSGYKAVAPRRGPAAEVPADAGDRGGNRRAGQGARHRSGRGRAAGDRDRAAPRRGRLRLRRPARGQGAGREPRREVPRPGVVGEETEGGYARELSEEEQRRQQEELEARIGDFDVVITTALDPRPAGAEADPAVGDRVDAPRLRDRRPRRRGGRELRDLTRPDEEVTHNGVTIIGPTNLPSSMPYHASQLYARNVTALVNHLAPEGELALDFEDEITAGACVTRKEEVPA